MQYVPRYNDADIEQMETLLTAPQLNYQQISYPVILKRLAPGLTEYFAPNFPELACTGSATTTDILIFMREKMEDKLRKLGYPLFPVPVASINCGPDECILQITLKL